MPLECKPAGSSDGGPTDAGWPDSAVDAADIPQADGMSCARSTQCTSMNCVDGVCCNTTCSGFCQACTQAKKGTGMDGTCGRVADMTDPGDEDCPGPGFCHSNAAGACHLPQGAACSGLPGPPYCFGSTCVDRVCCNTLCTLACYSCLGAETGGTDGTCAPVKMGTDPANECLPPAPNCSGVSNTCIP
ncbi:MAG: hypothetical protein IT370_25510 [Deltaproteobacteria bacterium]|nr:hypothetical protein [Deltaproteobacteria bacterium]